MNKILQFCVFKKPGSNYLIIFEHWRSEGRVQCSCSLFFVNIAPVRGNVTKNKEELFLCANRERFRQVCILYANVVFCILYFMYFPFFNVFRFFCVYVFQGSGFPKHGNSFICKRISF